MMMTIQEAREALLSAYQALEQAQAQMLASQQAVRVCEFRKAQCEAVLAAVSARCDEESRDGII